MKTDYDVIIIGASVAGCTSAIFYARKGLSVLLLEKASDENSYKKICTHFIQPCCVPILKELGLYNKIIEAGGIETKAEFWTEAGWIKTELPTYENGDYAINISREQLDPLFKKTAAETANITLLYNSVATDIDTVNAKTVTYNFDDKSISKSANLIVCADGRFSKMAGKLENQAEELINDRFVYFAYYKGVDLKNNNSNSLFWMLGEDMAFIYPLSNDTTLLSIYIDKRKKANWSGDVSTIFENAIKTLPDAPDMSNAVRISPFHGMNKIDTLIRKPVVNKVAFIGDATTALDPASGVGCGFAMMGASWLVDHTANSLITNLNELPQALEEYASYHSKWMKPHIKGIAADSRIRPNRDNEMAFYAELIKDKSIKEKFLSLTGRLITPNQFQSFFFKQRQKNKKLDAELT